jgi:hypothetical protein
MVGVLVGAPTEFVGLVDIFVEVVRPGTPRLAFKFEPVNDLFRS